MASVFLLNLINGYLKMDKVLELKFKFQNQPSSLRMEPSLWLDKVGHEIHAEMLEKLFK